jgi:Raf kinase inhibitor-like YbhB/YbcL family protein
MIFVTMNDKKLKLVIRLSIIMAIVWGCKSKEADTEKRSEAPVIEKLKLRSTSFDSGALIPDKFTCQISKQIFPNLSWTGSKEKTKSYVLIVDDPDAKQVVGYIWNHWLLYDIPSKAMSIGEGLDASNPLPAGTKRGTTSFNDTMYGGPCPPPGQLHHYYFKLYELDVETLNVGANSNVVVIREAMKSHVLDSAEYVGLFQR